MKAIVFHAIGDIRLEDVSEPTIQEPTDAIVRLTASAICGTDLHFVRGTFSGMKPGTILGHEGVGVVESVGPMVRNFQPGDRVIIPSTVGCGSCSYCRKGYYAQCDNMNPGGKRAGTVFFGGPEAAGGLDGLQAEKARVPCAHINLVKLPDAISDDQAILMSDILPTGWFGADIADIEEGHTVAVFGCGPVGQFAIAAALVMGARVIAVDRHEDRLAMARRQGAEIVNFDKEDPVETIVQLTGGIGVDRAIDAVGVDAQHADHGPAGETAQEQFDQFGKEQAEIEPDARKTGDQWVAGDAPTQALDWAVEALAKAGQLSIIGVYPPTDRVFPIGKAMNKNLTVKMGNCNHRRYYSALIDLVVSGAIDPLKVLTEVEPMHGAIEAYEAFDRREPGWIKVELKPVAEPA
ncbi:zinc-dependent alcohol dehydrogenase [Aureimonas leprariae]|uniref:Glutathione-dependent formaldehyde dehydrogenase n=1 Tax=Plantimonas leprariae TaxID=2615207 RepID=A0A7V7PKE9_9HYPH|nr:zinc-dependent alcohol dehydrogenase [Aureimonas leprariae]KAB0676213.1 glutathione-dependent formaldehyde dehydrogenase [Aureimonas leprariae]